MSHKYANRPDRLLEMITKHKITLYPSGDNSWVAECACMGSHICTAAGRSVRVAVVDLLSKVDHYQRRHQSLLSR